jgi:hypothetical protein
MVSPLPAIDPVVPIAGGAGGIPRAAGGGCFY